MAPGKTLEAADSFNEQLKQALEHATDPAWLGQHSPLAMPYFLGAHLWGQPDADTAAGRGLVLRSLLREAAQMVGRQDADGAYAERLLELSFFQPTLLFDILDTLGIGRSTYYRHLAKAIQQLSAMLVRSLKPALRLEAPLPEPIHGRESELDEAAGLLQAGRSVALTGSSGMGKTSLGVVLASRLAPAPLFWFTVRPSLNDQLSSLVFALGYFLHRQGASSLWLQLVADGGKVDSKMVFSLVRHDLEHLRATPPLLCFDEVDLLRPDEFEDHGQILAFLESLRGQAPLLLIGQRRVLDADHEYNLAGLDPAAMRAMADQLALRLSADDLAQLHDYTAGNPRLIRLLMTLHRAGEPLLETLPRAAGTPSLELLAARILRRLDPEEQQILLALAVFRRFAPADAWADQRAALSRLIAAHLVQQDGVGGVAVMMALRPAVYQLIPPAEREARHLGAAGIRAVRGEYTAAAYHFIRGGRPEVAIAQWYGQREQEIDQGQAMVALGLFSQVSPSHLPQSAAELLVIIRSELRMLAGEYDQVREDLQSLFWSPDRVATVRARQLEGDVSVRYSQFDRALDEYQSGLSTATLLLEREVSQFHVKLGMVYGRQRDLDHAWREARLASYEVEHLQGYLQVARGDYAQSYRHYRAALAIAEELSYGEGIARTCSSLARVLAQQAEFSEATVYWERACQYYQTSGNLSLLAGVKANQAGLYVDMGRSAAAIAPAEEALELYTRLGESQGRGHAAHNLANAHQALGNLEVAADYARLAIKVGQPGVKPYSLLTLAEIRLAQQNLVEADEYCRQSIEAGERRHDQRITAYAWRVRGQAHLAGQQPDRARPAFEQALELFQQLNVPQEVEQTRLLLAPLLAAGLVEERG
jgi:tetratricopeptide (TPR) repeat protein